MTCSHSHCSLFESHVRVRRTPRWRSAFLGLVAGLVLTAPTALAQDVGDDGMPVLSEIMKEVEEIRGLKFKKDVPAKKQALDDFEAYLTEELEKVFPDDAADDLMDGLLRLGLLAEKIDIEGTFKQALLTQAGAYYDPPSGTFYYLMTNLSQDMLKTIASHELVHAMQDQHFDLDELMKKMENEWWDGVRNDDRILAARFLVEGEATYVQTLWQMKHMMEMDLSNDRAMEEMVFSTQANMPLDFIVQQAGAMKEMFGEDNDISAAIEAMKDIPPYIMEPLYAAYLRGAYFAMKLRHHDGWKTVAQAYKEYPLSTEQTLHPEKYLDQRDDPTPIAMTELKCLTSNKWERIDAAIHGEWYLGVLLRMHGMSEADSHRAVRGWDGDIYNAYRHPDGRVMMALATTWDSPEAAQRFARGYLEILPSKLKVEDVKYIKPAGKDSDVLDTTYECGELGGHGRLVVRGSEVFVTEGADEATNDAVIKEMKAIRIKHVR